MLIIETSQYRSVFAIIQYNSMLFFLLGPIANIIQDNYASLAADQTIPDKIEATLIIPDRDQDL